MARLRKGQGGKSAATAAGGSGGSAARAAGRSEASRATASAAAGVGATGLLAGDGVALDSKHLAVHAKKVQAVTEWLGQWTNPSGGMQQGQEQQQQQQQASRVLVLKGPPGCGKSTVVRVVASELGMGVHEWEAPTPTLWAEHRHLQPTLSQIDPWQRGNGMRSGLAYTSKLQSFLAFVATLCKYSPLPSLLHPAQTSSSPLSATAAAATPASGGWPVSQSLAEVALKASQRRSQQQQQQQHRQGQRQQQLQQQQEQQQRQRQRLDDKEEVEAAVGQGTITSKLSRQRPSRGVSSHDHVSGNSSSSGARSVVLVGEKEDDMEVSKNSEDASKSDKQASSRAKRARAAVESSKEESGVDLPMQPSGACAQVRTAGVARRPRKVVFESDSDSDDDDVVFMGSRDSSGNSGTRGSRQPEKAGKPAPASSNPESLPDVTLISSQKGPLFETGTSRQPILPVAASPSPAFSLANLSHSVLDAELETESMPAELAEGAARARDRLARLPPRPPRGPGLPTQTPNPSLPMQSTAGSQAVQRSRGAGAATASVILVDDLPYAASRDALASLCSALNAVAQRAAAPIVVVMTEGTTSSSSGSSSSASLPTVPLSASSSAGWDEIAQRAVLRALLDGGATVVSFNPVTVRAITKALAAAASSALASLPLPRPPPPSQEMLQSMAEGCCGDLRRALCQLQLHLCPMLHPVAQPSATQPLALDSSWKQGSRGSGSMRSEVVGIGGAPQAWPWDPGGRLESGRTNPHNVQRQRQTHRHRKGEGGDCNDDGGADVVRTSSYRLSGGWDDATNPSDDVLFQPPSSFSSQQPSFITGAPSPSEAPRDHSLTMYHAIGKFLYNKRRKPAATADPDKSSSSQWQPPGPRSSHSPPAHASAQQRSIKPTTPHPTIALAPRLQRLPLDMEAPETIIGQSQLDPNTLCSFLHENYLDFLSSDTDDGGGIGDAAAAAAYLSDAALLLNHRSLGLRLAGAATALAEEDEDPAAVASSAACSVAARGILFSNCHPAPTRFYAMRSPMAVQVDKTRRRMQEQMMADAVYMQRRNLSYVDTSVARPMNALAMAIEEHGPHKHTHGREHEPKGSSGATQRCGALVGQISQNDRHMDDVEDDIEDSN